MPEPVKNLGIMKPVGGGDPVPLRKPELTIGRRASCDIVLDFENVSGKHCQLRYINQVWHVRDLGSTNGTKVNGAPFSSDRTILPDDTLAVANHVFTIDYALGAASAALATRGFAEVDEEEAEAPKRHSLLELAGLARDDDDGPRKPRPRKPPETIERLSTDEAGFEDALPDHVKADPAPVVDASDDEFFKIFEDEVPGAARRDQT